MLAEIVRHLRCPVCGGALDPTPGALRCPRGHTFDVARQGYVNLLTGRAPARADTAAMVAARAELLAAGHYRFLADAVAEAASAATPSGGLVVDVGTGTGYYLAAVLDRRPGQAGLGLDISAAAARRAARAHPHAAAAVCDVWRGLPLADGCAEVILDVFAPRNGAQFHRVLRPDGLLLVVTPHTDHLAELAGVLGLLDVDPDKERRLDAALGEWFVLDHETSHGRTLELTRADAGRLVAMGPSAWHADAAQVTARLATAAEPVRVTASMSLRRYRPRS